MGPNEEHIGVKLFLNFGQQFRKSRLKIFLFLALAAILFKGARLFVNLRPYEEHFGDIILNLSQQVRGRCCSKRFKKLCIAAPLHQKVKQF